MRIVIDLQSCQTEGSKNRGIGRYSIALAEAMLRIGHEHEFYVILNGAFDKSAIEVRNKISHLIPHERIKTFEILSPCSQSNPDNKWRYDASKRLRDQFISNIRPDVLHQTSLFEGLGDDAVTDIVSSMPDFIHTVTVYDLIPYIHFVPYLEDLNTRSWYFQKLQSLKRADLLLSISSSSREEAIEYLHIEKESIVNISSAIDKNFKQFHYTSNEISSLKNRYQIKHEFIMYTGGIDHRKNIEGLIRAYSNLSSDMRANRQLAIVCSIRQEQRSNLLKFVESVGLSREEVIFTGYVPEPDLIKLYNCCELFVFPSLHEGFGLPALEAMACGAPTIGSRNSSIPEVIGLDDALFDASNIDDITSKIQYVLSNPDVYAHFKQHSLRQAKEFSWESSARKALAAMEEAYNQKRKSKVQRIDFSPELRLAFVAPFPPLRTGIATYSAELLPELCRFYDVDIVSDQKVVDSPWAANCNIVTISDFQKLSDANFYDRIIYQVGNSEFHSHMPDLILNHPGVVVLHDYFLSGLQNWRQATSGGKPFFVESLIDSHGYPALAAFVHEGVSAAIERYPANAHIVQNASGLIVHSRSSETRLGQDYGIRGADYVKHIPHLRTRPIQTREKARASLGLLPEEFLICSFGILAPEKKNELLLEAFESSDLVNSELVRLVFVGSAPGEFGKKIIDRINLIKAPARVIITGYADEKIYHDYLAAADLAVQLRGGSRGETSGAVLEVLNYGIPLIVNSHGTMSELPKDTVVMLPDNLKVEQLADTIISLVDSPQRRQSLSKAAKRLISQYHSPTIIGQLYHESIENFAANNPRFHNRRLLGKLADLFSLKSASVGDLSKCASIAAHNLPQVGPRRLYIDITNTIYSLENIDRTNYALDIIDKMILDEDGLRIEPIYADPNRQPHFFKARKFISKRLGYTSSEMDDELIDPIQGDIFLGLDCSTISVSSTEYQRQFDQWRTRGLIIKFVVHESDIQKILEIDSESSLVRYDRMVWFDGIATIADELIINSKEINEKVSNLLNYICPARDYMLKLVNLSNKEIGCRSLSEAIPKSYSQPSYWIPRQILRFNASDPRLGTVVGELFEGTLRSRGTEGFLLYGPYASLSPGLYECRIWGSVGAAGAANAWVDVAISQGEVVLYKNSLDNCSSEGRSLGLISKFDFILDHKITDLEVRIWVSAQNDVNITKLDFIFDE